MQKQKMTLASFIIFLLSSDNFESRKFNYTECVTDLDLQSEIIIFESIFSTIESNSFYWGSSGISENWLKPKTEPP